MYVLTFIRKNHTEISEAKKKEFEKTLNEAVLEAVNDDTFRKIQRVSYGQFKPNQVNQLKWLTFYQDL
ncbi:hypothetical protein TSAR_008460 [Trichomalopsis sarcophagae]|uniref:Uncharacterized protein n=1 Tax=Trichomalopsis sarcophagae TaxID=543379 RepID=A0A232FB62_9HYME|nr:hypothetical protein TSAR_008460 [Trichomalopsis sarcophagae]